MQTLTVSDKSKNNAAVSAKSRRQSFFAPARVQPKLTIGTIDDPYEREADAMADRVMRMPAADLTHTFFKPAPSIIQRQEDATKTLTEGAGVVKDQLEDKPGFSEWKDKQTDALKKKVWDDQPMELKAGIIGFGLSSAGILAAVFATNPGFRADTIKLLDDKNIALPLSLIPYHEYFPLTSFKYKLPSAEGNATEFSTEFEFKPYLDLLHQKWSFIPKTDITLGVDTAYSRSGGFGFSGGSIKMKFGGGIINLQGFVNQTLPVTPMLVSGNNPGESPMWIMRTLPGQFEDQLPKGSGVFLSVDVLRLPELWKGDDKKTDIQRKCAKCDEEEKLQRKETHTTESPDTSSVEQTLQSSGSELDKGTRSFMEKRFGYDFSNVKIHTDSVAAKSAGSINALAYTSGNNIVFNSGQYSPDTDSGKKLLVHELTHVVQQNKATAGNNIRRFSDPDHHVIEEVALKDIFSEEEIRFIEQGNMQRDYSQLPPTAISLLVPGTGFGKYKAREHFDHFIFDKEKNRWVSHDEYEKIWDDNTKDWVKRVMPVAKSGKPKITPLQYIESELSASVEKDKPDSGAFIHMGNAFHTIEDFFAHSNFIELTQGDYSSGKELTTHPSGLPGPSSEGSILGNVSDPVSSAYYDQQFKSQQQKASPLSHGLLAKDFHSHRNHALATTLAALLIRQIAGMLKNTFTLQSKEERIKYVKGTIFKMLTNYLRPPSEKDKWWEKMLADDNGQTSRRIKDLEDKTPITVNQLPGSPLRSFEATKYSSWKAIGLGTSVSLPLKNKTYFTAGYMLYAPGTGKLPDDKIFVAPRPNWEQNDKPAIIFGAQVSGSFDLTDLFTKRK
jgi:hypothetical protein